MPEPTQSHSRLTGWRVIVTGAGSRGEGVGTGKAIAILMAREGAKVALLDLDAARVEETRQMITERGGPSQAFIGDLTSADDCRRMTEEALTWLGGLDVLVNNVGLGAGGSRLEAIADDAWRLGVDINLNSAFYMTRAAIPALLEGAGKAVVNIASVAGMRAHGSGSYGPAKAALIQFTREVAVMYGADGLRANVIAPGHIMTPLAAAFTSQQARDTRRRIAPLEIEGDAWDVAQATVFLAGPESRFITAACLPVDGGVTAIGALAAHEHLTGASATR